MEGPIDQLAIEPVVNPLPPGACDILLLEPLIISCYSVHEGEEGKYVHPDQSRYVRILKMPHSRGQPVRYSLADGYVPLAENGPIIFGLRETRLNMLLQYLSQNISSIDFQQDSSDTRPVPFDFVSYRGVLAKMMSLPYETRDDLLICAQKYKGTIYLAKFSSLARKQNDFDRQERQNVCSYGGLRFKQYLTRPLSIHRDKKISPNLNHNCHFSCILSSELGDHSLLYSGHVDAIDREDNCADIQPENFVDIKTTSRPESIASEANFKKNMLNWWSQCYLGAVPAVYCGYRDRDMVVRGIQKLSLQQMKMKGSRFWSTTVCITFLDAMLSFIKKTMENVKDPNLIYEFQWEPGDETVSVYINHKPVNENDHQILFDWYFDKI